MSSTTIAIGLIGCIILIFGILEMTTLPSEYKEKVPGYAEEAKIYMIIGGFLIGVAIILQLISYLDLFNSCSDIEALQRYQGKEESICPKCGNKMIIDRKLEDYGSYAVIVAKGKCGNCQHEVLEEREKWHFIDTR
ncbi:MAG: hypothetical protein NTU58_00660 [Candidatus Nealsonbacteria bacterium]|nr:hypothetical protein [Candidatus Nealsonbacteria bacterium]